MDQELGNYIGTLATKAVLYEVNAAPKPGLVDRMDSGAHDDMDYFTFVDSALAIGGDFRLMAEEGIRFEGDDLAELFAIIREIGKGTEKKMFEATEGVNTHKGIIFSIGILSALAGYLLRDKATWVIQGEELCCYVPTMVGDLCSELKELPTDRPLTNGEKLYKTYGITGIRGEVMSGFNTVMSTAVPIIREYEGETDRDSVLVTALLGIMSKAEDSNVLHRQGKEGLDVVREQAQKAMDQGAMMSREGRLYIRKMEEEFKYNHISPGGAADLLAVALFISLLEGRKFTERRSEKLTKIKRKVY